MEDKGKSFLEGLDRAMKDNEDLLLSLIPGYMAASGFESEEEAARVLKNIRQLMVGWFTIGYVAGIRNGKSVQS